MKRIAVCVVVLALTAGSEASADHVTTLASANYVLVDDFGSNSHPTGCGDRAVLSGGFANKFDRETSKLFLFGFNPIEAGVPSAPAWRVTVANRGVGSRGGGKEITYAYCIERPPRLHVAEASERIRPSRTATATARCPRGMVAVSGGFADESGGTNGSLVFGFRSMRVGTRGWRASVIEMSGLAGSRFTALVICRRGDPGLVELRRTLSVQAGGARATTIHCAPGLEPWSAGFESSVAAPSGRGAYPYVHKRVGARSWRGAAFAEGGAATFTLRVYCGPTRG